LVLIMARMIGYVLTYGAFGTNPPTLPYRQVRSWGWGAKQKVKVVGNLDCRQTSIAPYGLFDSPSAKLFQ